MATLERDKIKYVYERESLREAVEFLRTMEAETAAERDAEAAAVRAKVDEIQRSCGAFRAALGRGPSTRVEVERLKALMDAVEDQVGAFRAENAEVASALAYEERMLTKELAMVETRIADWGKRRPAVGRSRGSAAKARRIGGDDLASPSRATNVLADLPEAVGAFDAFLRRHGGHTGGWDDHDHAAFLRLRNRLAGDPTALITAVVDELPGRSAEAVASHEDWFLRYRGLLRAKKAAIADWKAGKEALPAGTPGREGGEGSPPTRPSQRKQRRSRRDEAAEEEKRRKVAEWRARKEAEAAAAAEVARLEEQIRVEKARTRHLRGKARVEAYKEEKAAEERWRREQAAREAAASRYVPTAEEVEFRRKRDLSVARNRRAKVEARAAAERRRAKRLQAMADGVAPVVEADPDRLLKPTAGVAARHKDAQRRRMDAAAGKSSRSSGSVATMARRAVPTWRRGIA